MGLFREAGPPAEWWPGSAEFFGVVAYIELLSEFQVASTLPPTELITAIAATTIKPAIRAYSSTSPPFSSRKKDLSIISPEKETHRMSGSSHCPVAVVIGQLRMKFRFVVAIFVLRITERIIVEITGELEGFWCTILPLDGRDLRDIPNVWGLRADIQRETSAVLIKAL